MLLVDKVCISVYFSVGINIKVFLEAKMTFFVYHNFFNSSKVMSTVTRKPSEAYPSILHSSIDYLKIESASRFKNAIMN